MEDLLKRDGVYRKTRRGWEWMTGVRAMGEAREVDAEGCKVEQRILNGVEEAAGEWVRCG